MSFCSYILRQSTYVFAFGNFFAPNARCSSLISQRATTISPEMAPKCASPRPHVPMRAMLSLLLGASAPKIFVRGRIRVLAPMTAADLMNWRRFIVIFGSMLGLKCLCPYLNNAKLPIRRGLARLLQGIELLSGHELEADLLPGFDGEVHGIRLVAADGVIHRRLR